MTSIANATNTPQLVADGQLMIGSSIGLPQAAVLSAGAGIAITVGHNTILIASTGGGTSTVVVTTTSATMSVSTNYIANNAALVTLTMPATANPGDIIRVSGLGTGGWKVQCNGGQVINFGANPTSSGGTVSSTNTFDAMEITCLVANTTFSLNGVQGFLSLT